MTLTSFKTAPQIPSRRALAGIALVSVLSAVENQRLKKAQSEPIDFATEDMSGELQTIPARHGVATFVPRNRTIKVINTYGKQVVSMWAFSLGAPPEEDEEQEEGEKQELDEEEIQKHADELKEAIGKNGEKEGKQDAEETGEKSGTQDDEDEKDGDKTPRASDESKERAEDSENGKETQNTTKSDNSTEVGDDDPPEQAPDTPEENKASSSKQPAKRSWASYLPSIPYRNKGKATQSEAPKEPNPEEQKAQNEENTKKWSSYLPTGKGFSSYVPNVQIPDSKGVVNAFKTTHARDPNKSYAEQLYDFSKTPVGAGTIAGKLSFNL